MTSSDRPAAHLYHITHLGTGAKRDIRIVEAGEVAAVIKHAGEHGMQVLVCPYTRPHCEPGKEDAS